MSRFVRRMVLCLAMVAVVTTAVYGVRWSPGELDLVQDPGTEETYRLLLQNDSDSPVELKIYVADWLRDEHGMNDFGVPLHGARWSLDRSFAPGDVITLRYAVQLPGEEGVGVAGSFRAWGPQITGEVDGVATISAENANGSQTVTPRALPTIHREIESVDSVGVATILLTVRTPVAFDGLTVEEVYSEGVQISSIHAAGGTFDTINRSNAGWITLSHSLITLEAEESREILMTVATPEAFNGMTWSIIHAESRRVSMVGASGTQIVAVPTVGLKVFVTSPGSEIAAGEVRQVDLLGENPLRLEAVFANTGNVQLVVTGEVQVVSQTGETVRAFSFSEFGRDYFRILPESQRTLQIVDGSGEPPLPEGIYQAVVSFDYGGDSMVVGARAFRIR